MRNLLPHDTAEQYEPAQLPRQYLIFAVGEHECGVARSLVEEIHAVDDWHPNLLPREIVRRVMRVCGTIMPVVDMRPILACRRTVSPRFGVLVVLRVAGKRLAMVVDDAFELIDVYPAQIARAPLWFGRVDLRNIIGSASHNGRRVVLLNVERLFARPGTKGGARTLDRTASASSHRISAHDMGRLGRHLGSQLVAAFQRAGGAVNSVGAAAARIRRGELRAGSGNPGDLNASRAHRKRHTCHL